MRNALLLALAWFLLGCQTTTPPYDDLLERVNAGKSVSPEQLHAAYLARDGLADRLEQLAELEQQALALADDEPLKLGSIGTAILDNYYGSITGHYVMARFYEHVESGDAAVVHADWVERLAEAAERHGDGALETPYPAITPVEPRTLLHTRGLTPVGSIYRTDGDEEFKLLIQAKPAEAAPLENVFFDLSTTFESIRSKVSDEDAETFNAVTLIGYLAQQGDSSAQASVGAYLISQERYNEAIEWLSAASRTGNLVANTMLARAFWEKSRNSEDDDERGAALERVLENYLHAIAVGSTDSMYALGVLYLEDYYGEDNRSSGMTLLQQASDAGHASASAMLAALSYQGEHVDRDLNAANRFYATAITQEPGFVTSYARFLLDRDVTVAPHADTIPRLEDLADADDPQAMLLLGNLYARGIAAKQSLRRAQRWYERAVETSEGEANVVNEVAWVLTVTDITAFKRADYALTIMEEMMNRDEEARKRPEYLDTWAAAHAANGNFERAVALQNEALENAREMDDEEVLQVLQDHLDEFESRNTLTEPAP